MSGGPLLEEFDMIPLQVRDFISRMSLALVAASNIQGQPHLAASRDFKLTDGDHVEFTAWFCKRILENVTENPRVAVTIMDAKGEEGYQLNGQVVQTNFTTFLNGFAPEVEQPGLPQVQSRLRVRVEGVMLFSSDPHTDRELLAGN